ncbi:L,D-transpeptidase [Streptomyces griseochromogenes]|uniref:L,D-transpeptidase n=1 Tax=Streptomyces griseochromogenes TaxID=68214 RepID=UPI0037B21DB7
MSDDRRYDADLPGTGLDGTGHAGELSGALRTLAQDHQAAPPVPGTEIRRLAVRRGRRRRTTAAVAGIAAAAAVAVTLSAGLRHDSGSPRRTVPATSPSLRPSPATSPSPSPRPSPATSTPVPADAVVDLTGMTMAVDGRVMPVSSGVAKLPTPTGRFTVIAKYLKGEPKTDDGVGGSVSGPSAPWTIELLSADRKRTTFIDALTYDTKAPGHYATTGGWISLHEADAKWLFTRLDKGSVVLVTGRAPQLRAFPSESP